MSKVTSYILFIVLFFSATLNAQEKKILTNPEKFKTELKLQAKETKTIIASFTQEKHFSFMKTPQLSEGIFYYEKANKMRWEQTTPFNYVMLINEETVRIKDNGKEKNIKGANKMMSKINKLMLGLVNGEIIEDNSFTTNYFVSDDYYIIELIPKHKRLQSIFNTIELSFSKTTTRLKVLTFFESTEDKSVIKFFDEKFNQPIHSSIFLTL